MKEPTNKKQSEAERAVEPQGDALEQFFRKFGGRPESIAFEDVWLFGLRETVALSKYAFEKDPDNAIAVMEQAFMDQVRAAMSSMKEELKKLRSTGQKSVIL